MIVKNFKGLELYTSIWRSVTKIEFYLCCLYYKAVQKNINVILIPLIKSKLF